MSKEKNKFEEYLLSIPKSMLSEYLYETVGIFRESDVPDDVVEPWKKIVNLYNVCPNCGSFDTKKTGHNESFGGKFDRVTYSKCSDCDHIWDL